MTILEPASERGAAGIDELQEQTVRLLNFQPAGSKLFKGQIAFNILPETETANGTENLIRSQLAAILGNSIPSPSLMMHQAPVFHSESFSMFVRFAKAAAPTTEEIRRCLAEASGGVVVNENPDDGPSPVSVVGSDKVHIGRIAQDPGDPSIYGFWMTADNLRIAASNALGIREHAVRSNSTLAKESEAKNWRCGPSPSLQKTDLKDSGMGTGYFLQSGFILANHRFECCFSTCLEDHSCRIDIILICATTVTMRLANSVRDRSDTIQPYRVGHGFSGSVHEVFGTLARAGLGIVMVLLLCGFSLKLFQGGVQISGSSDSHRIPFDHRIRPGGAPCINDTRRSGRVRRMGPGGSRVHGDSSWNLVDP